MSTITYHSIWLMPSGKINDELSRLISQLSQQYAAPVFPPHVTLLGELTGAEKELAAQTRQLAAGLQPFQVNLTVVDVLDAYFRCLFLRAEETPALLAANRQARQLFKREQDPKFMPHLSLLYGDFDRATKDRIIEIHRTRIQPAFCGEPGPPVFNHRRAKGLVPRAKI